MIGYVVEKRWFKNTNHAIWFLNSVFFFIFICLFLFSDLGKWVLLLLIVFHLSPIVNSVNKIFRKEKSEIYSRDCIWFNSIMVVLYVILVYKF